MTTPNTEDPMQQQQNGDEENGGAKMGQEEQAIDDKKTPPATAEEEGMEDGMDKLEDNNNDGSSSSRSTLMILAIVCGVCILIIGIVALSLYLAGYFTFNDPCVGVVSFVVSDIEMGQSNAENSNSLLGLLSSVVPTLVTLKMSLELEVNNTNTFKLDYSQMDGVDTIYIPEFILNGDSADKLNDGPIQSENDFFVGNWNVSDGSLDKKASNDIPVEVAASIDLSQPETLGLAPIFLPGGSGGKMAFLINGGIEGSAWVPFMSGEVRFICLVQLDNILELGADARIRCLTTVQVGKLINVQGELNHGRNLQSVFDQPVDPACYV